MIELRPQLLQKVGEAFAVYYSDDFKKNRWKAVHIMHEASSMLYMIEQTLPKTQDENHLFTDPQRRRICHIRNTLEKLMGDYAGYENKWYRYPSLVQNPWTRSEEVTKLIIEGGYIE